MPLHSVLAGERERVGTDTLRETGREVLGWKALDIRRILAGTVFAEGFAVQMLLDCD